MALVFLKQNKLYIQMINVFWEYQKINSEIVREMIPHHLMSIANLGKNYLLLIQEDLHQDVLDLIFQ